MPAGRGGYVSTCACFGKGRDAAFGDFVTAKLRQIALFERKGPGATVQGPGCGLGCCLSMIFSQKSGSRLRQRAPLAIPIRLQSPLPEVP
jgi:hypothetical protein